MLANKMISTIQFVEKECHGITQMYASRISYFQKQNLPEAQGVVYDSAFDNFVKDLESVMGTVRIPTAKKILNNWYLWAKNNLEALSKVETFKKADNAIDWLIKNNFRVDHKVFAQNATAKMIADTQKAMPKGSVLFTQLKTVADKVYPGSRGFTYDYLVKTVAAFSEAWE